MVDRCPVALGASEAVSPFISPRERFAASPAGSLAILRAFRTNVLSLWPEHVYRAPLQEQRLLGRKLLLFNHPEAIARVLKEGEGTDFGRSTIRYRLLRPVTGNGLLTSEGEDWRRQRRAAAPAFAPRGAAALNRRIAASVRERLQRLARHLAARPNQPIELLPLMQDWSAEISGRSMFSFSPHLDDGAFAAVTRDYVQRLAAPTRLDVLLPISMLSPRDVARRRFSRRWMAIVESMMGARATGAPSDPPEDLLDLLLAAAHEGGGDMGSLRDQVATMIVAGFETTSLLMFWSVYLLANSPSSLKAVAQEAEDAWRGDDSDLPARLPFTRAVISEALRLYPPAFMIARRALRDVEVAGIEVPKGSLVLVSPWVVQRHHDNWDRPDEFDPRRFLPGAAAPGRYAYLPFSLGPRVCIGAQLALSMATIAISGLMRLHTVSAAAATPILPNCVVTMRPRGNPMFRLTPRA